MKPDSFLITKAHTKMLVQAIITLDVVASYEEAGTLLEQYRVDPPSVELITAPDGATAPASLHPDYYNPTSAEWGPLNPPPRR